MPSIVFSMIIIVGLGLASLAVVAVGMRGKFSEKVPTVADRLAVVGHHLNGEAQPPASFVTLYEQGTERVQSIARRTRD